MEEKNTITISVKSVLLVVAVVIICIMGYFLYNMSNEKQVAIAEKESLETQVASLENAVNSTTESKKDSLNVSNNSSVNENSELTALDVNDELVKKLYGYVLKYDDADFAEQSNMAPASFYKKNKTTYSTLSDLEKTLIVLKNYGNDEIKNAPSATVKKLFSSVLSGVDIEGQAKSYENINEKSVEIFNQNNSNWKDYEGTGKFLEFKDNTYYLIPVMGGGLGNVETGYSEIQKAEKDENYVYIYDKFIYTDGSNEALGENDSKTHIYTTSDKVEDIGTISGDYEFEELYKKYESKLNTFKHTFQKADNGNYYWVSSEIVD